VLGVSTDVGRPGSRPSRDAGAPQCVAREGELGDQQGDEGQRRDRRDQLNRRLTAFVSDPSHDAAKLGGPMPRVTR
jgi:hypothetical protein